MEKKKLPAKQGRPSKDAALVLRDRYWVLYLKSHLPQDSYACIERKLFPHLRVTRREHGEGLSQPGALSKVAAGTRGLSTSIEGIPDAVRNAEDLVPGATAAYTSILWSVLAEPSALPVSDQKIGSEVRARLFERHFSALPAKPSSQGLLSLYGVRRVSRLWHRDALGLLLYHCPASIGVSRLSLTAEAYVSHLSGLICRRDLALRVVQDDMLALMKARFGVPVRQGAMAERLFLAPKVNAISQGLRLILRP